MADILNLSFGCGNTLLADQLNQIVNAINQLANQNGAQRGITLNTNTRELSITNNSSTADLDSILPYGIKNGGSWDDFITFYRDNNNNYEVDINGSGGRQCDLGVTGNIRTGLSNEYSYVRTDILLLKDGRNDSYIGKLYSSNGNLYYLYVDGSGQKTKYYPALLITREKINLDGDTIGFELNVDIPQNQNNNNNTIGLAATDSIGGIKLWADGDDLLDTYDYPVKLNHNGSAYVTVNWSNQGTTLAGLMGNNAIGSESLPIYWSGSNGFQACSMDTSGITAIDLPNNLNTTLNNGTVTIPAATNGSYGVVKLGYDNSSNSNRHPVESDNGSGLYIELPIPTIGANDNIGDALVIKSGNGTNEKEIGWAPVSLNGVAGVSSIKYQYDSSDPNNPGTALVANSGLDCILIPGDGIHFNVDQLRHALTISTVVPSISNLDSNCYLMYNYSNTEVEWTNVAPGGESTTDTTYKIKLNGLFVGTGSTDLLNGSLIYAPTTSGTSSYYLKSGGNGNAPSWQQLNLSIVKDATSTPSITLEADTTYKLTVGDKTYLFKTPLDLTGGSSSTAGVTSFNGQTGAVTYNAPVTSVNGQTGAVSIITTGISENTFTQSIALLCKSISLSESMIVFPFFIDNTFTFLTIKEFDRGAGSFPSTCYFVYKGIVSDDYGLGDTIADMLFYKNYNLITLVKINGATGDTNSVGSYARFGWESTSNFTGTLGSDHLVGVSPAQPGVFNDNGLGVLNKIKSILINDYFFSSSLTINTNTIQQLDYSTRNNIISSIKFFIKPSLTTSNNP